MCVHNAMYLEFTVRKSPQKHIHCLSTKKLSFFRQINVLLKKLQELISRKCFHIVVCNVFCLVKTANTFTKFLTKRVRINFSDFHIVYGKWWPHHFWALVYFCHHSMVCIYWIKKYNKWWMSKWHLNPQNVGFWGWYLLCDREAIVQ